jgi:hypothetical protein
MPWNDVIIRPRGAVERRVRAAQRKPPGPRRPGDGICRVLVLLPQITVSDDVTSLVCRGGQIFGEKLCLSHPAPRVQGGRRDQAEVWCPQVVFGKFRPRKVPASRNRGAHVLRRGNRFRNS